jgi:D-alanyl-lipoteichoic acid acyltransferase DltB (MBOAT superfamily)
LLIPVDADQVTGSIGFASMWTGVLTMFFRAALGTIGMWDVFEGGALFLGIRLRPNFRYVLKATTPSQFWRAWRATMTNWLIRYVYIPLGGNRRHQIANIFAAFFVSTVWHCLGVVFLRPATWRTDLVPIVTWGAVNWVGIAAHAEARRRRPPGAPTAPLLVVKWGLTMVFGSLTVLLLGFSLGGVERFPHVVRTLIGLEGW